MVSRCLCVHSSSVGMNFRNLTIFHGGGSGFEGSQWFPRRAVNVGVYKIESKPCSMFKVIQQLEFIDLFFPCCRFLPLPSATPKLTQAFWTYAPCLMFPIVPLLLLSAPITRSLRMSPDPRHMCTLSTPTVGINWLFYGTWLSFKSISFRNLRQEL